MPSRTWNLASKLAHLRQWLQPSEVAFQRDHPRQQLELRLTQHEPATLDHAASCVYRIGLWENNLGAYKVLEGDPSGWGHLGLGVECGVWRLRTRFHLHTTVEGRGRESSAHRDAACCVAATIALREDALADWCGALKLREFARPDFLTHRTQWGKRPFYPFMTWLYANWRGGEIDTSNPAFHKLGVYKKVVEGWDDDAALAKALKKTCDYHCSRTVPDPEEKSDQEFWEPPFPVFPAELLAIQRVREEQTGRKVPVDHPLMNSPLGSVPDSVPKFEDPLLERFKERIVSEERRRTDG